jgi:hypothetical protein
MKIFIFEVKVYLEYYVTVFIDSDILIEDRDIVRVLGIAEYAKKIDEYGGSDMGQGLDLCRCFKKREESRRFIEEYLIKKVILV